MSQTLRGAAVERDAEPAPVSDDVLARIIDETARRVEMRASRPSPIHLRSWQEIEHFAEKAARSGMVPKDFIGKPDAICIAVQMGSELGLAPMQSLQNIAVVNGRPAIWGDALPGLCRASGMCKSIREWSDGEGDALTFYCEAVRKDQAQPIVARFSVADAKRAKLWQENPTVRRKSRDGGTYEADSGPWYSYPDRMLQMRARGFALRDAFPDVLKGLLSAEEARDIPWDDTGLSIVPPVATDAPIRAVAAPTPRAARVYEAAPKSTPASNGKPLADYTEEQWNAWLLKLRAATATCQHRKELVEMASPTKMVGKAVAEGPDWVRAEIDKILAESFELLPADPEDDADPDEVHIIGEDKVAAG